MARWGLLIVLAYGLVAVLTPLLVQAGWLPDPNAGLQNPIYAPPSPQHWCGTDRLGRDVCVRTLAASGVALQVVLLALVVALVVGVPLGMVSGYLGGWVDRLLVLLMDTLYTLPVLLLSVVLAFLLGRGLPNAAAALCVVYIPQYFRVVRNQTAQVKAELYVEAARSLGASAFWILRFYLFRNVITSVPVLLTLNAADAVLVLGGLGFLGLGLPEPSPSGAAICSSPHRPAHRHLVDGPLPGPGHVRAGAGPLLPRGGSGELAERRGAGRARRPLKRRGCSSAALADAPH